MEGKKITYLEDFERGDKVHLFGRIRSQRYIDRTGNERICIKMVAQGIAKVDEAEPLTYQITNRTGQIFAGPSAL